MPYPHGATALWRARIAATLGDGENAVAFFRQAVAEGIIDHPYGLEWVAFERIRDYPPWQELMRPKGRAAD